MTKKSVFVDACLKSMAARGFSFVGDASEMATDGTCLVFSEGVPSSGLRGVLVVVTAMDIVSRDDVGLRLLASDRCFDAAMHFIAMKALANG